MVLNTATFNLNFTLPDENQPVARKYEYFVIDDPATVKKYYSYN